MVWHKPDVILANSNNLRMKSYLNSKKKEKYFMKIKEIFSVKLKMFSVDYYFLSYQTIKNLKNIFLKLFYTDINRSISVLLIFFLKKIMVSNQPLLEK
jgi:hypothetical protein